MPSAPVRPAGRGRRRRVAAAGVDIVDFGMGDPREPVDPRIERALADALPLTEGYPRAHGLLELGEAVARWCGRRFGARSTRRLRSSPRWARRRPSSRSRRSSSTRRRQGRGLVTEPGYPVPQRGAQFARAASSSCRSSRRTASSPTWRRSTRTPGGGRVFWINYPNNPTGADASADFHHRLASSRRSTTSSSPPTRRTRSSGSTSRPPRRSRCPTRAARRRLQLALEAILDDRIPVAFVAGDTEIVAALKAFRPTVGTAPQEFVQRASIVAWDDEEHVERNRALALGSAPFSSRRSRAGCASRARGHDVPLDRPSRR